MMTNRNESNQLSAQIEDLVQRIQSIADPVVRTNVVALVQSVMDLHGKGLERISELVGARGEVGRRILADLSNDELVGGLLMLYQLHPEALEHRVEKAIQKLQNDFRGCAKVELLSMEGGTVRVRVTANEDDCSSAFADLEQRVRDEICNAAPDADRIEIERRSLPAMHRGQLVQLQVNAATGRL